MQANLIIAAALVALAACADGSQDPNEPRPVLPTDTVRTLTVQERQVAAASNRFAFDLLRETAAAETTKPNLMISPLSVSLALGMTLNGAAGSTFDAMRGTLAFGDLKPPEINAAYRGLMQQLQARDPKVEWRLANSIWYDNEFNAYSTFVDTVRHYFGAEVQQLDFTSALAPQTISRWAEERTGGRIKELIKEISSDEVMFLVNAVYFKAPWTTPFEPDATRDAPFTRANGSRVDVKMMSVDAGFRHISNADVKAVEMLYADSAYSMVLWQGAAPTEAQWTSTLDAMKPGRVMLRVPKFKFDYDVDMKPSLSTLGMGVAFSRSAADFSRIAPVPPRIFITRVKHKSFIDVHELGTEAAAATAVGVGIVSMPPELVFDRAFFFAIRERSTGAVLFAGRVDLPGI
ncbi:MAG: serpin family protein [Gemmatimonadota bacterium]